MSGYINQATFRTQLIELIKRVYPDLTIVRRFQNVTQPVNILEGEEMLDIYIERVEKTGTDYIVGTSEDTLSTVFGGDRLVVVSLEYYGVDAVDKLSLIRDLFETFTMRELMRGYGFMEERQDIPPYATTRLHGNTQYVESAEYNTRFNTTITYVDGVTSIDNGTIDGSVSGTVDGIDKDITITY